MQFVDGINVAVRTLTLENAFQVVSYPHINCPMDSEHIIVQTQYPSRLCKSYFIAVQPLHSSMVNTRIKLML